MSKIMTGVAMSLAAALMTAAGTVSADGAAIFAKKCATCHAKDGTGNEKMGKMLKVEAADLDLTDEATQGQDDDALTAIVTKGKGKSMKGFEGKLSGEEIAEVVAHVRSLAGGGSASGGGGEGAAIFKAKCATCHAKDGTGNEKMGKMLKVDAEALDLTDKGTQEQKDEALFKTIKDGKGKSMKGFAKKLSDDEISAVLAHLRTLAAE